MAGYYNFSMSNNARTAYANGEKPLSRWTKEEILSELEEETAEKLKPLTARELREILLYRSSWHHTSSRYNRTSFYSINKDKAEEITEEEIREIIKMRKERIIEGKEVKETSTPSYITALVQYTEWEGTRNHPKPVNKEDIVFFRAGDKMVMCPNSKNYQKRLTSLCIVFKIEQKTKYASAETLKRRYERQK